MKNSFDPFVRKVNFMEKIHKEILGLMGKIDIDCRDEKGSIIIDLAGQLDVYNSHDVNLLIEAYGERGFEKFILKGINVPQISGLFQIGCQLIFICKILKMVTTFYPPLCNASGYLDRQKAYYLQ